VKDRSNNNYCAFAHFRFEYDDDKFKGVIYCYELQTARDYQRQGIGSLLMKIIEQIGSKFKMSKVLLTCFGYNQNAMDFYIKKLGYRIDRSSPSRCVEGKTFYEILSLKID
jgi:ribosomal protein S18 acetylase RimI-like enzyme